VNEPISPYAATKRATELLCFTHHERTRMPTACLRFFTVFGPRQRPDLAIAKFMRKIAAGESIEMYGDGTSSRDYTYIDDIVAGVLAAYDRVPAFGYRVWNLGGSRPIALRELIAAIGRVAGRSPTIVQKPQQPGDVERTFADLTRSKAELGFEPRTTLEAGLARQWEWIRQGG
jgi:UDP-glucuronate 4-epimerase